MKGDYDEEFCDRCSGKRTRRIDRRAGRYHVDLPSRCPTKDTCERAAMSGFEIQPDPCPIKTA